MRDKSRSENYFEASPGTEDIEYGIGDIDMAIQVARDKLYTYPIRTLTQEYIANAYDACVEAGTDPSRIEITAPTTANPVMKIRDFGPGLSPERIRDVFTQYFKSTKRRSKKQAGFFGVGAKSAFAYKGCDSFTVVSYHGGLKTVYVSHLGQSKRGTLTLLGSEPSDEPRGVQIEIAVQLADIKQFTYAIQRAVFLWPKKPSLKLTVPDPIYTGEKFRIYKSADVPFLQLNTNVVAAADGMTPYEMPGTGFVENRVLVLDIPANWMGIAPSRETFVEQGQVAGRIQEVWDECHGLVRSLVYQGKYEVAKSLGIHRGRSGVYGSGSADMLHCPEFLTLKVSKKSRHNQSFEVLNGFPIQTTTSFVCIMTHIGLASTDLKKARSVWLRVRRSLGLTDYYDVLIVCTNAEHVGPVQDISEVLKSLGRVKEVDEAKPAPRRPKDSLPIKIMTKTSPNHWVRGHSDALQKYKPSEMKLFTSNRFAPIISDRGLSMALVPNDKRMDEALALGYETDESYVNRLVAGLSHEDLYRAALASSNSDLPDLLRFCNKWLSDFPGWPKSLIDREIDAARTLVDEKCKIKEFLGSYRSSSLPRTYYHLVRAIFPLLYGSWSHQKYDVGLYLVAKYQYLMNNPTKEYYAFLSLTEQLGGCQHQEPDLQPDERGPEVQEGYQNSQEGHAGA